MTSAGLSARESWFSFLVLMRVVNVWQWRHWYVVVILIINDYDCELRSWSLPSQCIGWSIMVHLHCPLSKECFINIFWATHCKVGSIINSNVCHIFTGLALCSIFLVYWRN